MDERIYYDLRQVAGLPSGLSSEVARELGLSILSRAYAPGDLLEDERTLAERYQVGRSVVRDAVKILVGKGFLDSPRGACARVRPRRNWRLLDTDVLAWYQSTPPDLNRLRQLTEVRFALEPKASRWAAERADAMEIAQIESALLRMEAEQESTEGFVIADALFHRAILAASHNEFIRAMEGVIYATLLSSIRATNRDARTNPDSIPFHREVYEAIAARDGARAERLMERLLADANRRLAERSEGLDRRPPGARPHVVPSPSVRPDPGRARD